MAMQLDLCKQVEKENCAIQWTERTNKEQEIKQALLEDQQQNFVKLLLYGGQGEHTNHSLPTFSDRKTPDGHDRSQSEASKGHLGARKPQASPGRDHKDTIKDNHEGTLKEEGNVRSGLEQPRLATTGEAIMGANKKQMWAKNRRRRQALQQAQQATT
jgi:hypothetical protein